jgi:hypothetical protein
MFAKIARVASSLLLTAGLAFAQNANVPRPASAARHGPAPGRSTRAPVPAAFAAMPDGERLAIQSDLVWLGDYEGMSAEEFDAHTLDAIKAFQRRHSGKETGVLTAEERAQLAEAAKGREARVGWRLVEDSATGARLGLPEKLVPHAGLSRNGSRWTSGQEQIQIETFRLYEGSLPALFEQEKKVAQRRVGYSALGANSFVIAGEQRLKKFVVRAQASGNEVRGVTILYDQATEGTMAPIAVAVSDTFQGFPDANSGPIPGRNRSVEYATAIVVSTDGRLLTLDRATDRCQSITVSGFGHADRVAEDRTGDLALIRLYGAHGLHPAPLNEQGASDGELTLYGFTEPLNQNSSAAGQTTTRLVSQGLDPIPNFGFSGAAALDGQGHFAGIADVRMAVAAGAGSASPQAGLIPVATVHAFLRTQGIAPESITVSKPHAMDQSVLRVICVRK